MNPNPRRHALPVIEPEPAPTESAQRFTLWENETFAVTQEGLAVKPRPHLIIPKDSLSLVGHVARTLPAEYSDAPFVEAISRAVQLHFPTEFPNGLKTPRKPEKAGEKNEGE